MTQSAEERRKPNSSCLTRTPTAGSPTSAWSWQRVIHSSRPLSLLIRISGSSRFSRIQTTWPESHPTQDKSSGAQGRAGLHATWVPGTPQALTLSSGLGLEFMPLSPLCGLTLGPFTHLGLCLPILLR